jgi:ribonuclease P protein component
VSTSSSAQRLGVARFLPSERIKKSAEIQRILRKGKMCSCFGMRLFWAETRDCPSRMAIALKKGYGTAVERNRAKRVVRESFRLMKADITAGFDLVFMVFPAIDIFATRNEQMARLCSEAGLLRRTRE